MKVINLDPEFRPFGDSDYNIMSFTFPGGETQVRIPPYLEKAERFEISTRIHNSDDTMSLLLTVDAMARVGVDPKRISLTIPYLPYARQDRVCVSGESLSIKVFANLINSMGLGLVRVLDCHSDVGPAVINNCINISNGLLSNWAYTQIGTHPIIVSPDSGSNKKIHGVCAYIGSDDMVSCDKVRDLKTGKITGFKVFSEDLEGRDCLIADDICDGGGTFVGLASELKSKNAGNLYLCVTHGIFSSGFSKLSEWFSGYFASDSFKPKYTCDELRILQTLLKGA